MINNNVLYFNIYIYINIYKYIIILQYTLSCYKPEKHHKQNYYDIKYKIIYFCGSSFFKAIKYTPHTFSKKISFRRTEGENTYTRIIYKIKKIYFW